MAFQELQPFEKQPGHKKEWVFNHLSSSCCCCSHWLCPRMMASVSGQPRTQGADMPKQLSSSRERGLHCCAKKRKELSWCLSHTPPLRVQIHMFLTSSPTTSYAGLLSWFTFLKECHMVFPHIANQQCNPFSSSAYSPRFQKFLNEHLQPNSRTE